VQQAEERGGGVEDMNGVRETTVYGRFVSIISKKMTSKQFTGCKCKCKGQAHQGTLAFSSRKRYRSSTHDPAPVEKKIHDVKILSFLHVTPSLRHMYSNSDF
jgi:hypothetical protein